jgi:hypothetical protein
MKHIRNFIYKVKRVIDFLPIVWNGHDFDSYYAIELFKHQLERTADMFDSRDAYAESSKMNAQKIRTAIRLMDKVYNDEYVYEYSKLVDSVYGETLIDTIPIEGSKNRRYWMRNEHALDDEHQKEIDSFKLEMFVRCYEKQKRAHKLLWNFIEHNIQRWWD